ncbi:hypothetical protein HYH02_014653 [Chlamydomonas schloesseri]|uniref:Transmembrane protein 218 n=1 Tax=Chlamydomonas schloesseri TaxID=2026947 RepID=A0A835SL48_9CHLO|nr:hypothetical protein HYH02_014653 [Chlamydomonas schloesseri]|eukprot:KAG2427007.1 hypothetical protein HYH02_014653 [Chlamydomonas schloesseri]
MAARAWFALQEQWHVLTADGTTEPFAVSTHLGHRRELLGSMVAGVGVGVFLIFFFLALSIAICLIGSRTKFRWAIYMASAAMFGIVALVLIASPKGTQPPKPPYGYNQTIIPMAIIMSLLCLGILVGGVFMLVAHVLPPLYARPLSYHLDVLEERRRW